MEMMGFKVFAGGVHGGDCGFDGLGLADGSEVGPCALDVAGGEEEFADFARGLHDELLVIVAGDLVALDQGEAEFVASAHEAGFEDEAEFACGVQGFDEMIEGGGGSGGGDAGVQFREQLGGHDPCMINQRGWGIEWDGHEKG